MDIFRFVFLALLLAATGCSSTASGPQFTPVIANASQPQIVVYRADSYPTVNADALIEVNGQKFCDLQKGGYFSKAVSSTSLALKVGLKDADEDDKSKLGINVQPRQTYYVRISNHVSTYSLFGLAGYAAARAEHANLGVFNVDLVNAQDALPELQSLHLSQNCQ